MSVTSYDLAHLADIVRLASFAVETRRVLNELQTTVRLSPEKTAPLLDDIPAFGQWTEMPETTSAVLDRVADQMLAMADELDARKEASK